MTAAIRIFLACFVAVLLLAAGYFFSRSPEAKFDDPRLPKVDNFRLLDHQGESHELFDLAHMKAIVIVAHGSGCPIIQKSFSALKKLRDEYAGKGVAFFLMNANSQDKRTDLRTEAEEFSLDIPILKDDGQTIAESLKFNRTATAAVIVPGAWRIIYHGPIDDRQDYSGSKEVPAHQWLRDALESVLKGQMVAEPIRPAKGCEISYEEEKSTFKDVAPIFERKCLNCHGALQKPPTNMITYEQIRGWKAMIREVIRTHRMPPVAVDPPNGDFLGPEPLSPGEERALLKWIEADLPFDSKRDPPALTVPRLEEKKSALPTTPDLKLKALEEYEIKGDEPDPRRFYQIGGRVREDMYISAFAIDDIHGTRSVHHINLFWAERPLSEVSEYTMDEDSAMSRSITLVPWKQPFRFPEEMAYFVPKGSYLIVRVHYETMGRVERSRPAIHLWLHKDGEKVEKARVFSFWSEKIRIPPGGSARFSAETSLKENMNVFFLLPHMHLRGRSLKLLAREPGGRVETLISIPKYNTYKTGFFWYRKPRLLPANTVLEVIGEFDNTARNPLNPDPTKEVVWGPRIVDEMLQMRMLYY